MMRVLGFLILFLIPNAAIAATYSVSVTRKGQDLYKVTGKDLFIATRYCYEYVYYEDSVLKLSGSTGEIFFPDDNSSCDVKAIYGAHPVTPGAYDITVSRDSDNWYEATNAGVYIRTSMCLSLALGEDAILKIQPGGSGRLIFTGDGNSCTVEGVYEKLSL